MALSLLCVSSVSGNWICSVCLVSCQIAGIGFGEGHLCATEIVPGDNMGWIKFISKSVAVFPYNLPSLLKLSFNGDKADKYLMRISGLCSHSGTVTIITSKIDFRFKPRSFCQHVDTGESRQVPRGAAWLANTPCFSHTVKQTLIATVATVVGLRKPEKHTTCSQFAADMTLLQDQLGEAIAALCVFGFLVPASFVSAVPGLKHAASCSSFG